MTWETYNFSDDFQNAILACLIQYPEKFYRFGEIIKPEFFNGLSAVEVSYRLKDYVNKYGKYPNFSTLGNYVFTRTERKNPERAKELIDYVMALANIDVGDVDAILDLSVKFAKERAIFDALRKIHLAQQEGKDTEVDAVKLMEEAMNIGFDQEDLGIELRRDVEKIVDKMSSVHHGIRTGFTEWDKLWKTGWAPGWLIVLLAPPKGYKTTVAINIALNMAMSQSDDADVMYYACEIKQEEAAMRAVYNLTGHTEAVLWEGVEKFKMDARKAVDAKMWGNFWFKGFPAKTTTIAQIKAHAKMTIRKFGLKPKAIFIDYADTVKPSNVKGVPDHRQQADIYTEARAMGDELGCCVVMPDRCNKETVGKKVPSIASFQGAFEKGGVVDAAIGLCATDAEYKVNTMRFFVFLNRHGPQNMHYTGKVDRERYRVTVDAEIPYNPDDEEDDFKTRGGGRKKQPNQIEKELTPNAGVTQWES